MSSALFARDPSTDALDCSTRFSADYYGFGVRLGVYFAWLSSYCANTLLPSEIGGALDTNAIFLLALLISLFRGSHMREIYTVDGLILMHLCSGFLFSSFSIWGYRTKHYHREGPPAIRHFGRFGTHFRLALTTAIAVYGNWFWWEGIHDGLKPSTTPGCNVVYTWLFGQWRANGGVRIVFIIMSLGTSMYYSGMLVAAMLVSLYRLYKALRREETRKVETGLSPTELKFMFTLNRAWNFVYMILCIAMIELTLVENNMLQVLAKNGGIGYPAQLLPLVVGALSFVRVLFLMYIEAREKQDKKRERIARTGPGVETEDAKTADAEAGANGDFDGSPRWPPSAIASPTSTTSRGPRPLRRQSFGLHIRSVFSPNLGHRSPPLSRTGTLDAHARAPAHGAADDGALPPAYRAWHRRYLVSWLPWLSVLGVWHSRLHLAPHPANDAESRGAVATGVQTSDAGGSLLTAAAEKAREAERQKAGIGIGIDVIAEER